MNVTGLGCPEGPRRMSMPSRLVSWDLGPGPRWVPINEVSRERRLPERFLSLLRTPRPPPCVLCSSGLSPRVCEGPPGPDAAAGLLGGPGLRVAVQAGGARIPLV